MMKNCSPHQFMFAIFLTGILSFSHIPSSHSAPLDPSDPEDAIKVSRKITCGSLLDGQPRFAIWEGQAYSRVPAEKDRLLFKVVGINTRQCTTVSDDKRGDGYRSVSREVMLYLDPDSGKVLRRWKNPWTDKKVDVIHVANDPVNMRSPRFAYDEKGKQFKVKGQVVGDLFLTTSEVPLFYTNPLGGDFQNYVGGEYQAIELFNDYLNAESLFDRDQVKGPRLYLSWARVSQWLPWMEMGSRPGQMIFHTRGYSVDSTDEMPDVLLKELEKSYPEYLTPPPVDDSRPNETSWTFFRKVLSERLKSEGN